MRNALPSAVLLTTLAMAATTLQAEEMHTRFFRDVTLGSGLQIQRWSGEGDLSIREISIPVTFIMPVTRRLSLDVVTGSGFASLDQGSSNSLNGLTDTKIRGSYIVGEELALITFGISTPTGKSELDGEEQQVSAYLSQNALRFSTPNFGQGLDINAGVATARRVGEMVVGVGVGYLLKGEFTPRQGGGDYKPGAEISLTAGLDKKVMSGDGKVTVDAVYTMYGEDESAGRAAFQSGNKILLQVLGMLKAKGLDWRLYAIERLKGDNTFNPGAFESTSSNGNQFEVGISALKMHSPKLGIRGLIDLKTYGANGSNQGKATMMSIGPGIRYTLSASRYFDVNVRYSRGEIDDATLSGIDVSSGIWLRF